MNIAWLGDPACHKTEFVGGKAANLSRLAANYTVPNGFCLTTEAFANSSTDKSPRITESLSLEIRKAYGKLCSNTSDAPRVAVRSSAVDEDGENDSFAGQHDTYLNITGTKQVEDAVQRCWESLYSDQAITYRQARGLQADDMKLAVLIQQLVHADISAVVFSTNPITGDESEVVITASWGLGESIVGGTVTPDTIILEKSDLRPKSETISEKKWMTVITDKGTEEVKVPRLMRSAPAVNEEQAHEMAQLALDLERWMGKPVDVECAYQDGKLYLLQCRPVTTPYSEKQEEKATIPVPPGFPVTWANPEDANLNWGWDPMHFPFPIKPLEQDIAEANDGFNRTFAYYGTPVKIRNLVINGYSYGTGEPTLPSDQMEAQAKRADEKIHKTATKLDTLWTEEWLPEIHVILNAWDSYDLVNASNAQLLEHVSETLKLMSDIWYLHFRLGLPVYHAMGQFHELFEDLFEEEGPFGAFTLLQGFDNKTLETAHALWDLSQTMARALKSVFTHNDVADILPTLEGMEEAQQFLVDFRGYLDEFGQRNELWGLAAPTWIEDPTPAIKNLKDYIENPMSNPRADLAKLAEAREVAVAAARKRIADYPAPVSESFDLWLKAGQMGTVLSEDHGYWIDVGGQYRIRRVFMEVGRRFAMAEVIVDADDVFFLRMNELRDTLAALPGGDWKNVILERKAEHAEFMALDPPLALGVEEDPGPDNIGSRTGGKFFGTSIEQSDDPLLIKGNAGSPGKIQGAVKVLASMAEAEKLGKGDVLVTRTTAPSWTPLFSTAAAVVTDTGGILSHCAVVAREYAIPAVVGTGNATDLLVDGQIVEVDGEAGNVRIIEPR